MPRTQSHDPDLDDLPGFETALPETGEEFPETDDELVPDHLEPSQPESQAPETTSTSQFPPESEPESPRTPSPPTATSSEPDPELTDGLEFLAGGLFELVGQFLNRMVKVRRRQQTSLWLVTDEEAEAFAAPMARIAERRLPDELKQGDAKDLLIAGSVAVEYTAHNVAGEPGVEPRPVQAAYPTPPPAPAAAPSPAPAQPSTQQPAAAPEPPPLVAPDI